MFTWLVEYETNLDWDCLSYCIRMNCIEFCRTLLDKQQIMNKHTFKSLISGLSATSLIYSNEPYPELTKAKPTKNQDLGNMRCDWMNTGGYLSIALHQESSKKTKI
jgi:hypothetical protein